MLAADVDGCVGARWSASLLFNNRKHPQAWALNNYQEGVAFREFPTYRKDMPSVPTPTNDRLQSQYPAASSAPESNPAPTLSSPDDNSPDSPTAENPHGLLTGSTLLREFAAEREEILRHKWIESEKAQCDIGFEKALCNWLLHHRSAWLQTRRQDMA